MDVHKKVIAITGGGGVLGGAMAQGLAEAGAEVILIGRTQGKLDQRAAQIQATGAKAQTFACDVLAPDQVQSCWKWILGQHGRLDVLINAAGGNLPAATIGPDQEFHQVNIDALDAVFKLNLQGTIIPSMEYSKILTQQGKGSILNISSMAAQDPLTRVVGYSAAKAGVDNFTRWLAVELATKHGEGIRVNAIAPGFFIGEQNRALLLKEDGTLTARGKQIIDHTPLKRFGKPEELVGITRWLCSDSASFVTGAIFPVDGGFGAWRGV